MIHFHNQKYTSWRRQILKIKWCASHQLLVLQQNRLYHCVHHVMEIVGKLVAC